MKLGDLMLAYCVIFPVSCGIAVGWHDGVMGLLVGISLGLSVAFVNVIGLRAGLAAMRKRAESRFLGCCFVFAAFCWFLLSIVVVALGTLRLTHHPPSGHVRRQTISGHR